MNSLFMQWWVSRYENTEDKKRSMEYETKIREVPQRNRKGHEVNSNKRAYITLAIWIIYLVLRPILIRKLFEVSYRRRSIS